MEVQHVGVALGGEMGVACWEVIGYHIKNPHHFSFQRYMKCVFSVHPVLNAPEQALNHLLPFVAYKSPCVHPIAQD